MKKNHLISLVLLSILATSCQEETVFPEVKNLSEYPQTTFLPTLENNLTEGKNAVYCTTLLYAWDEIRKALKPPLKIEESYADLTLLNNSKSYIGVLKPAEYTTSIEVSDNLISAKAEFKKSLPFELTLTSFKNRLTFNNKKVASFGNLGEDETNNIQILYYKDDENFVLKLTPKDKEHEIVLFNCEEKFNSMSELVSQIKKLVDIGIQEQKNDTLRWKYYLEKEDEVIIPKFAFNIETDYNTLVGNKFNVANTQEWEIIKAWQRTAFVLNEAGAEIESEAEIEAVPTSAMEVIELPKPKKMHFDKAFFIMLKRTDATNPYLGLWVDNTELMIAE